MNPVYAVSVTRKDADGFWSQESWTCSALGDTQVLVGPMEAGDKATIHIRALAGMPARTAEVETF